MKPIPFKEHAEELNQFVLFPSNIFELLPEDHECFLFADLLQQIETSELEHNYSHLGQHAYHPGLIVSILIYAYSRGVFSSRQIEQRCNEDLSFMFIAQQQCPNFRVLSDFRKNNLVFFKDCFKQTVQLAMQLKLSSLGHISIDGSKFKANTSKHKAMTYGHMNKEIERLNLEIDQLTQQAEQCDRHEDDAGQTQGALDIPKELKFKEQRLQKIKEAKEALEARENKVNPDQPIDNKKQISFADTEANIMGKKGDGFDYNYNAQISVDSDNQIIVGEHISQKANDYHEVKEALEQVENNTGQQPDKASLDNGYHSGNNLNALEAGGIDAYVAVGKGEKTALESLEESDRRVQKSDFEYDEKNDTFTCPQGQIIELKRIRKDGRTLYEGDNQTCSSCPLKARCCNSSKGQARSISGDVNEAVRQRMKKKMDSAHAKEIYSQRKVIVEPPFGHIKNGGFKRFSLRGLDKVSGEFSLVCAAHNLKKIMRKMKEGLIRPLNVEQVNRV